MPIDINAFSRDPHVQRFIHYLAAVIRGDEPIAHGYLDRYLYRLYPDLRNGLNPQRYFQTLEDAFAGYYWPDPTGSYVVNQQSLAALRVDIQAAWAAESEADLRTAIEAVLWWGAGNRRSRLYTANTSWLDDQRDRDVTAMELLRAADAAFSATPVFNENAFEAATLRSNAGFTKVYALLFDDFIIYDSRVAAALGFLVTRYLSAQHPPVNQLPDYLNFARMNAAGGDNRDASTRALRFRFAGSHAHHAQSNWIANRVLEEAVCHLFEQNLAPPWIGLRSDALRRIEAALFMLGKHIPVIEDQEAAVALNYDESLAQAKDGIDDDAGPRVLHTLSRGTPFLCESTDGSQSIKFRFGRGARNCVAVDVGLLQRCLDHFRALNWFPIASAHVACDRRRPSSLGRWLCESGNVTVNIASYLAAFLVDEELAAYRQPKRLGGELRILRSLPQRGRE